MTKKELKSILFQLHGCSFRNEQSILKSKNCSCFLCQNTFPANSIKEWCDCNITGYRTALCPNCGIDSVIGDADYDLGNSPIIMNIMSAQFFGGDMGDLEIEGLED